MSKFSIHNWRYKYLNEHHGDDFPKEFLTSTVENFLDQLSKKDTDDYNKVEEIIKKHFSVNEMNTTGGGSSIQSGDGEGYFTPYAFKKNKKNK